MKISVGLPIYFYPHNCATISNTNLFSVKYKGKRTMTRRGGVDFPESAGGRKDPARLLINLK